MSAEPLTAKDLELFEMAGGSPDPQYVPGSSLFGDNEYVTLSDGTRIRSLSEKPAGEKDEGAVQGGGARRLRRRRASRKTHRSRFANRKVRGRNRSTGRRPRFSLSLRAQIRLRK